MWNFLRRSRKLRLFLGLFAFAFLVSAWLVAGRLTAVAAVQDSLTHDWEISFGPGNGARPAALPAFIDDAVGSFLDREFYSTIGKENRDVVYHERFRSLFRGPIREIYIYYPVAFRGDDLGNALARFPRLRRFRIYENESKIPTKADWMLLCARLRELPLEEIEIGGESITDATIIPLSGDPHLRVLTVSYGHLTPACAATIKTLPHLEEFNVGYDNINPNEDQNFPRIQQAIRAVAPSVKVTEK